MRDEEKTILEGCRASGASAKSFDLKVSCTVVKKRGYCSQSRVRKESFSSLVPIWDFFGACFRGRAVDAPATGRGEENAAVPHCRLRVRLWERYAVSHLLIPSRGGVG